MTTAKKKPVHKKPAVHKSSSKKLSPSKKLLQPKIKTPAKVSTKTIPVPAGREHHLAEQVLSFVDEAAALLRSGVREGAATTADSRIAAKKKAHDLLEKASSNLSKAIEGSTSVLHDFLGKI